MWQDDGNGNYSFPTARINKEKHDNGIQYVNELKIKAEKFDELQKWWWWLQRRTHNGHTPTAIIRRFLNSVSMIFEPYEEEDK